MPVATAVVSVPWTLEEDTVLLSASTQYGPNWDLICDLVNSCPSCKYHKRTRRQCYERWGEKGHSSTSPQVQPSSGSLETQSSSAATQRPTFAILQLLQRNLQKKKPISSARPISSSQASNSETQSQPLGKHVPYPAATNFILCPHLPGAMFLHTHIILYSL